MKIAIVGAGSVGIASKFMLNKIGIDSTLFEASKNLGGILRDLSFEEKHYFSGCQYVSKNEIFYTLLPNSGLTNFIHRYGSYSDIFGEISVSTSFAGPTINKMIKLRTPRNIEFLDISIMEKIEEYPKLIRLGLQKWLTNIGVDASKMHHSSLGGLAAGRIFLPNQTTEVKEMRHKNPNACEFYGLLYINHTKNDLFSIPRDGFSSYFDVRVLPEIANDFYPNQSIRLIKNSEGFKLIGAGISDSFTKILWTGNPNPILKSLNLPRLDSHNLRVNLIVGEINQKIDFPFYVQVFSERSNVLRIYVYEINGKSCFTIEKIDDGESTDMTISFAKKVLKSFSLSESIKVTGSKKQNRFVLQTIDDFQNLIRLNKILSNTNMISSGWHKYGRDAKIKYVAEQINYIEQKNNCDLKLI